MNKLLLFILVALASASFLIPFSVFGNDLVQVDLYKQNEILILSHKEGELRFNFPDDIVYSSSNPYDFFPELIDGSNVQKLELLPNGKDVACNAVLNGNKQIAGNYEFCLVLAIKTNIPLYVHKDLLKLPKNTIPESL